jgi:Putative metallopeptidase
MMKSIVRKILAIAAIAAFFSGLESIAPQSGLAQEAIEDNGDLILNYVPPEDETYNDISQTIQSSGYYEEVIAGLNETFAFPQDIKVTFSECGGEVNAYYGQDDSGNPEITMCYELIQYYSDVFASDLEAQEDIDLEVFYSGFFTFLHELGHALVDQYQLPITGKEEDSVDSFAAVMLLLTEEEDAVLRGIEQFHLDSAEETELDQSSFADEHSLSSQRFYNMACLVYGSNPEGYADWVGDDWLPESRAEQCPYEYEQISNSWSILLAPYLKN